MHEAKIKNQTSWEYKVIDYYINTHHYKKQIIIKITENISIDISMQKSIYNIWNMDILLILDKYKLKILVIF